MNRRILLIDPDVQFRDLLLHELSRYRIGVEQTVDGERAIASANADPPALFIIAADEPDKHGFKTFQKCRKAIAKVPIALITSSVAATSFKRHGEGKVHAELYLDKRGLGTTDLVAKLDALIGLGVPEDDMAVPVEVDDIPLDVEGDVVVDETVGEDHHDFEDPHAARTVGPPRGAAQLRLDSVVDAELDATFAALLGDDSTAAPIINESAPSEPGHDEHGGVVPGHVIEDSGFHTPLEDVSDEPIPEPVHEVLAHAPEPAHDEHAAAADAALAALEQDDGQPEPMTAIAPALAAEPADPHAHEDEDPARRRGYDSAPSIPLDVSDIESYEDAVEELPDDESPLAKDRFINSTTAVEPPPIAAAPVEAAHTPPSGPTARAASPAARPAAAMAPPPGVDLGLDVIAEAADREQSGVHDRRSLRKIGDLEREVAQLKGELERARHDVTATASGGREREFLGLREQLATRDRDLRETRDQLSARDRVLADVRDQLRQARVAHQTATAHVDALAARVAGQDALDAAHRGVQNELAVAKQELEARAAAVAAAEAARHHAEREVATERAARAANASEAERILRAERDQLVARHRSELDAERGRGHADREAALAQLHAELTGAHAGAIADATATARAEAAAEHARAREAAETEHARARADADAAHGEALSRSRAQADTEVAELVQQLERVRHDAADGAAELQRRHDAALAEARAQHDAALAAATERGHGAEHAARAELAAQAKHHAAALERAQAEALDAATSAAAEHADAIEALEATHANALAAQAEQHRTALAAETDALAAERRGRDDDRRVRDEAIAAKERERDDALADAARAHRGQLDELAAARGHDAQTHAEAMLESRAELDRRAHQLEALRGELAQQTEDHDTATAALVEEHRIAVDAATAAHEAGLSRARSQAQAELDRAAKAHAAELDRATRAYAQDRDGAAKAHADELAAAKSAADKAAAIARAEHDRALAVAKADRERTAADAERALATERADHERRLAAAVATHDQAAAELTTDRDELRRGLSGAREGIRRVEGELATAVQTIADRNAELRSHAAGIAERDQRIADLRRELDALEQENAQYQEQVLRAYQRIKTDEAMVARAKKAMAIALTVLDAPSAPNGPAQPGHHGHSESKPSPK